MSLKSLVLFWEEHHVFKKFKVLFWEASLRVYSLSNYVSSRVWLEAISDHKTWQFCLKEVKCIMLTIIDNRSPERHLRL